MNLQDLILTLCLLSSTTNGLVSVVDMCNPCHHINTTHNFTTSTFLHRMVRDLGAVRDVLDTDLSTFMESVDMESTPSRLGDYGNWSPRLVTLSGDDLIDDLFLAYRTLTAVSSNLTLFNVIRTRRYISYPSNHIQTPVCDLWKALRNEGFEPPCIICHKRSKAPTGTRRSFYAAINFVYISLQRAIHTLDYISQHFESVLETT